MTDQDRDTLIRALLIPQKVTPVPPGIFGLFGPPTDSSFLTQTPPAPVRLPAAVPVERLVYFAFDFDDIIRVNNVRMSGTIGPRINRNSRGFRDRSIWEKSNAKTKEGLKHVMRGGVKGSGVVCVLIGTTTWNSFWVRYEIAHAVIGERGLLTVDLNSINHDERKTPDPLGVNPLQFMGVFKHDNGHWYLAERKVVETASGPEFQWQRYDEYTLPVKRPGYIPDIEAGTVVPLASNTKRFDFMRHEGHKNMGQWFDFAAKMSGR